jgi:glycosyltransferase involved in cell wall biosynthesis
MGMYLNMNIAFVIDTLETPNAGTEKQLLKLMDSLDRDVFTPYLIVLRNSSWLKQFNPNYQIFNVNLPSFKSRRILKALLDFKRYCNQNDIVIVQTFFRDANVFGTIAAFLSGIKIIISSRRNYGLGYWHTKFWLAIMRGLKYMTTCYIANAQITADYTTRSEKVDKTSIHVIHNGLDIDKFKEITEEDRISYRFHMGIKENEILIGTIANLREIKNIPLFINMASKIHKKYPNTRFVIVGDGPERNKVTRMISNYALEDAIMLVGQQRNVMPYLCAMDIGILCSKSESLSNSIIEYMAAGLPCVVSDVGGNSEAIGKRCGYLFKSDDIEDFIKKIEPLIESDRLRYKLGMAGREYAFNNYDQKRNLEKYQEIYQNYSEMKLG